MHETSISMQRLNYDAASSPPKRPKRFQCRHCQRYFARLEHLQRHERTRMFISSYIENTALKSNKKADTQEKPFTCDQCEQRFSRSDLLIRHKRLSHSEETQNGTESQNGRRRGLRSRRRADAQEAAMVAHEIQIRSPSVILESQNTTQTSNISEHHFNMPLTALSIAAEQVALQGITAPEATIITANNVQYSFAEEVPIVNRQIEATYGFDFEDAFGSLAGFLDNAPLSSQHFPSFVGAEQPMPFFSPGSALAGSDTLQQNQKTSNLAAPEESGSFSRFGSRLPSLQPEESPIRHEPKSDATRKPLSDISVEDIQIIEEKLWEFSNIAPAGFELPSRLALSRYIAGYLNGFHEHMPCLHVQTMSIPNCSIELILAMAAVGAQYCFESDKGMELFHVSREIAMQRIGQRDAGPRSRLPVEQGRDQDLMQTAQALFLLMAMASWAKQKEILRRALSIQSTLAILIREDGLRMAPLDGHDVTWEEWIAYESIKRTKFIVFCFFNLHCIVYNVPPLILSSELDLPLPCSADEFRASSAEEWLAARQKNREQETNFQDALNHLFERQSNKDLNGHLDISSLGNYVLIHALIQHIFFVRQIARRRNSGQNQHEESEEMSAVEQALRKWQLGWKENPESSLDPSDPNGPIAFNSTALLRLAYIRLNNIFVGGPGHHALATRDPLQIAHSFRESPAGSIRRTRKFVRAVLHSAHALSIPIKIGIGLVARNQTFTWSIQHSLCSLECAFLLCKWLEAIALADDPQTEVSDDEKRICWLVKTMLDETEYGVSCEGTEALQSPSVLRQLSAGVLRVWAQIFKGTQTWAIVDIIGTALNTYADMLTAG